MAKRNQIIKVVTGSNLYGTNRSESDFDYVGIFIPDKEYVYGLKRCDEVDLSYNDDSGKRIDFRSYSLLKFIKLAINNNPNIMSVFFCPDKCIPNCNTWGWQLLDAKKLFLSKKAYHTFRGYAHAQRRKITTPRIGKRKENYEKFGYDTKFAMQLIRLLYEGLDLMTCESIPYPSPHRKVLLDIVEGKLGLDWVYGEADRLEKLVDEAYIRSNLQYAANEVEIEKLQINMLESFWKTF